jgi:hypothetical protein
MTVFLVKFYVSSLVLFSFIFQYQAKRLFFFMRYSVLIGALITVLSGCGNKVPVTSKIDSPNANVNVVIKGTTPRPTSSSSTTTTTTARKTTFTNPSTSSTRAPTTPAATMVPKTLPGLVANKLDVEGGGVWKGDMKPVLAFESALDAQKKSHKPSLFGKLEPCPTNPFYMDGIEILKLNAMYDVGSVAIYRLSDKTKLYKVSSNSEYYLNGLWREKAAMAALDAAKLNISPLMVPEKSLSVSAECKVRSMMMDFVEGENLLAYFRRGIVPSATEVLKVGRLAVRALEKVHGMGLVHGDIHGGNMMYDAKKDQLKIIDYGRAQPFVMSGGKHIMRKSVAHNPSLNPLILSPRELEGIQVARGDDLFRLAEVLVNILQSPRDLLDMMGLQLPPTPVLINRKRNRSFSPKVPSGLQQFYKAVVGLEFAETPDYDKLVAMLA